ncbi:NAD(P)H-dependent oxidoreductase [Enterococcus rivorum]|uniref:NAD(P)H oxidoreductase n=1 Tax=Enterococcus rivorum TaxID=762845 RepID=A0A1E5KTX2_9ENTE|nr:NAD(P)H-dependent oxidoreductase [Enterococcus rivorum]MBP2100722.1 putative NADPH-quinone reductase [Enterococcus rivorum]OEH81311.1 NAD(P)H oxidoreductase [Enterococcus rivorum]
MKTLVIVAHPNMKESRINSRRVQELKKYSDQFTIHEIYEAYPDEEIDVKKEQQLIESHDKLVFQFPIYWFNCPPLMKKWFDEVFTYGWAYGSKGDKLVNKKIALAVSSGIGEKDFSVEGRYHYTLEEILVPFKTIVNYCKADYQGFIPFYGAEEELTEEKIESSLETYIDFLKNF